MAAPVKLNPISPATSTPVKSPLSPNTTKTGTSFVNTLSKVSEQQQLKFSSHAQKRLEHRNISLGDDDLHRLEHAIEKAQKRGGKESLVLMDELAFIVNVRERLVVTAMDTQNRGEGVFTNIDSVVLADPSSSQKITSTQQAGPLGGSL